MLKWFSKKFLSLKDFHTTATQLLPWVMAAFMICIGYGVTAGLFFAPADYQQGDGFRIIYVHVPSAFIAMGIYFIMAVCAFMTLVWRITIASMCMSISAVIGAWFAFLTLVTGSIWGKPMWGTWWIWDARLTSMLILFFLYLGFLTLHASIGNTRYRERICAILTLTGTINLPIIHYSVVWWNTLHQGPTITKLSPSIAPEMLYPLIAMIAAFFLFYLTILLIRLRNQILLRKTTV